MYIKYIYAVIITVFLGMVVSCDKEDVATKEFPPYFSTSPSWDSSEEITELKFKAEGETKEFKIATSVAWEIVSNADWFTVTPNSGEYNATIKVTAKRNESLTDERIATIELIPEQGESITITITQEKAEYLIFTDITEIASSAFGQKGVINLSANASWTASTNGLDYLTQTEKVTNKLDMKCLKIGQRRSIGYYYF